MIPLYIAFLQTAKVLKAQQGTAIRLKTLLFGKNKKQKYCVIVRAEDEIQHQAKSLYIYIHMSFYLENWKQGKL